MYTLALYQRTTDILFQAYFNDTLKHNDCSKCPVALLILAGGGDKFSYWWDSYYGPNGIEGLEEAWSSVFLTRGPIQTIHPENYQGIAKQIIDSTGYTWQDLAKIEFAFESAPHGMNEDDHVYNGLVAVLEVLKEIHGISDTEQIERFERHYKNKQLAFS